MKLLAVRQWETPVNLQAVRQEETLVNLQAVRQRETPANLQAVKQRENPVYLQTVRQRQSPVSPRPLVNKIQRQEILRMFLKATELRKQDPPLTAAIWKKEMTTASPGMKIRRRKARSRSIPRFLFQGICFPYSQMLPTCYPQPRKRMKLPSAELPEESHMVQWFWMNPAMQGHILLL